MGTLCTEIETADRLDASTAALAGESMAQSTKACKVESQEQDDVTRPQSGKATKKKRRRKKRTGRGSKQHDPISTASETKEHANAVLVNKTEDQARECKYHRHELPCQEHENARSEGARTSEEQAVDWLNVHIPLPPTASNVVLLDQPYRLEASTSVQGSNAPHPKPAKHVARKQNDEASFTHSAFSQAILHLNTARFRIAGLVKDIEFAKRKLARHYGRLHVMEEAVALLQPSLNKIKFEKTRDLASSQVLRNLELSKQRCAQLEWSVAGYERMAKHQAQKMKAAKRANLELENNLALRKATADRLIKTQVKMLSTALKEKARAERRAEMRGTVMAAGAMMYNLPLRRDMPALFETEEMVQSRAASLTYEPWMSVYCNGSCSS